MSSQRVLELPKNVEQLVLDCFDEEQCKHQPVRVYPIAECASNNDPHLPDSAGLAFLTEILGPPVVPSQCVLNFTTDTQH